MGSTTATLLTTREFELRYRERLRALAREEGQQLECVVVPVEEGARIEESALRQVDIAFLPAATADATARRRFFGAALRAPRLRWMHLGFVGLDHAIFERIATQGVTLTNSPGATAKAIALSALTGLLCLARGFPRWMEQQRRKVWVPTAPEHVPRDLAGQTLLVLGVGAIGSHLARLAGAVGLHVVGVRRSSRRDGDPVDELHSPGALHDLLPRADWLAVTCPLTEQTRGWIDAGALRALPRGARLLNVARGAIVDEKALIDALQAGHLAGAYLDVFEIEPLPESSPLWSLPDVIVTPHDSHASRGNAGRAAELFLDNLARWLRGDPLAHVVGGPRR